MEQIRHPKILIVGSCNTDMIVRADTLPVPGETILGESFITNPGGKGANQAIAASRLGGDVSFISKIGNDLFGLQTMEILRSSNIDSEYIFTDRKSPSGVALVFVDSVGENSIVVAPGANSSLSKEDIRKAACKFKEADIVLIQLEIPVGTAEYAVEMAIGYGKKVVLNPAPATALDASFLNNVNTILPNRIEAQMLSGIRITDEQSAFSAAEAISSKGVENVVITLGKDGAYVYSPDCKTIVKAANVHSVDTTGAGDTFCGAFCVYLAEGNSIYDCARFANAAAALATTRVGAQSSIPYRSDIVIY